MENIDAELVIREIAKTLQLKNKRRIEYIRKKIREKDMTDDYTQLCYNLYQQLNENGNIVDSDVEQQIKDLQSTNDKLKSSNDELQTTVDTLRKYHFKLRSQLQNQIDVLKDQLEDERDNDLHSDRIKWFESRDKHSTAELTQLRNQYNDVIEINKRLTRERSEILNRNRSDDEKDKEIASLKLKLEQANEEEYYRKKFREIEMNKELEIESETRRLKKQEQNKNYYQNNKSKRGYV